MQAPDSNGFLNRLAVPKTTATLERGMDRDDEGRVHMRNFLEQRAHSALSKTLPHRTGNDPTICTGTVQISSHTLTLTDFSLSPFALY
jgi:hypothetical protein